VSVETPRRSRSGLRTSLISSKMNTIIKHTYAIYATRCRGASPGRSPTTSRCKTALTDRTPCRIETMIVQCELPRRGAPLWQLRHAMCPVSCQAETTRCRAVMAHSVRAGAVGGCPLRFLCLPHRDHTAPATTSKTTAQDGEAHGEVHGAHGAVVPRSPQRLTSPRCQMQSDGDYSTATGDSSGNGPSASGVAPSASGPTAALSATATAASASDAA
jgi:hypothetical protein